MSESMWETSSGLVDEYDGKITEAWFEFDDNYNSGETLVFKLSIQTDDPELGDGGTVTEMYPCGRGWEAGAKGASAHHESGKARKFNKQSGMGLLIDYTVDCLGDDVAKLGQPNDAETWVGLAGTFTRVERKFTIDGQEVTSARMLPSELTIGGGGAKKAAKKAPAKKAAAKPADDDEGVKLPVKIRKALETLAEEASYHDDFVERAFAEVDGIEGDEDLEAIVMDADGFYAEHA